MDFRTVKGESYFIDTGNFEAVGGKFINSFLDRELLRATDERADADVVIFPLAANVGTDQAGFEIGIPELPFAVPGVGAISLPAFTLLGREPQKGRSRLGIVGTNAADGSLALATDLVSTE